MEQEDGGGQPLEKIPKLSINIMEEQKICKHFVTRKKRFCKMTVAKGKEFCGEHEPKKPDSAKESEDRIQCPLDAKHSVYRRNLQKHLKICNARKRDDLPEYIDDGANRGSDVEEDSSGSSIKLSEIPADILTELIAKIDAVFTQHVQSVLKKRTLSNHRLLEEELQREDLGKETKKHLVQTAQILTLLEEDNFIQAGTSFVEFGAGKGQLSCSLMKLMGADLTSQIVLVDRASLRHKKDNKLEGTDRDRMHRIRADITDLCLDKLQVIKSSKRLVGLSKHLCGAATDLTLRCILNKKEAPATEAVFIALCCHHRCEWTSFVGKDFFKLHGFSQKDFLLITKMASYAICGTGMSREMRKLVENGQQEGLKADGKLKMTTERREEVGLMCKRIIDYARVDYLTRNGYNSDLIFYVDKDVTLENVALVCTKIE